MIPKTISEIEGKILKDRVIPESKKHELLTLLAILRDEVGALSETHIDHAHSIAGFTGVTTHEATRRHKNPDLLRVALEGLRASVRGFEASHPRLVQTVNEISVVLSNMGI